jgi:hypothetical protein
MSLRPDQREIVLLSLRPVIPSNARDLGFCPHHNSSDTACKNLGPSRCSG